MKIDVTQIFKNYQGQDVMQGKEKLTLREVISNSLNAMDPQKPMTAEHKNKAFQISVKVWAKKEVDLTLDDRKFIKDRAGEVYNPLIYGRVCDILEGKDETEETNSKT